MYTTILSLIISWLTTLLVLIPSNQICFKTTKFFWLILDTRRGISTKTQETTRIRDRLKFLEETFFLLARTKWTTELQVDATISFPCITYLFTFYMVVKFLALLSNQICNLRKSYWILCSQNRFKVNLKIGASVTPKVWLTSKKKYSHTPSKKSQTMPTWDLYFKKIFNEIASRQLNFHSIFDIWNDEYCTKNRAIKLYR